jgi:hypothetical protein
MKQAAIDIDVYANLELEGVNAYVYIGDADTPACEVNFEWVDLISSVFEMQCVPSGPIVYDTDNDGVQEILNVVDQLRNAADDLEERVRSSKILLRDKWVADNGGIYGPASDEYKVSYAEYLNHIMEK